MVDPIRVLVVDDHQVVRRGLRTFLEVQDDIEVVAEADDGTTAVAEAQRTRPDVVLMDVRMPRLDGTEALRRIRAAGLESRVLVVTSFAERRLVLEALRAGARGYLDKDVDPEALAAAIRSVHAGHVLLTGEVLTTLLDAAGCPPSAARDDGTGLTEREREVLDQLAAGRSNREIARALALSEKTVKTHVSNVLLKLDVADRTQAALWAVRHADATSGGADTDG